MAMARRPSELCSILLRLMKRNKYLPIVLLAILTVVAGVLTSFYLSSLEYRQSSSIVLPERSDVAIEIDDGIQRENEQVVQQVTVDQSNVKLILQQLSRPAEYVFAVSTTLYAGESQSQQEAMGYVRGQITKIVQYENGSPASHTVMSAGSVYLWKEGADNFYTMGRGDFSYDDIARLATYEDLLDKEIQVARLISVDGRVCIEAIVSNAATGHEEVFTIAVYNGLLKSVELRKDGKPVAKSELTVATVEAVDNVNLMLPNGLLPTE